MSDELTVANRNESWLKGIADGDTDSLEPMTHKELWYKAIADGEVPDFLHPVTHEELWLQKIAESGGGGGSPLGSVTIVNNTSQQIGVTGVEKGNDGVIYSRATHIESGESGEVFMIPAYGSTAESVGYVSDCLEINMNQNAVLDNITLTGSGATINKIGIVTNKRFVVAFEVYAPVGTTLTFSNGTAE